MKQTSDRGVFSGRLVQWRNHCFKLEQQLNNRWVIWTKQSWTTVSWTKQWTTLGVILNEKTTKKVCLNVWILYSRSHTHYVIQWPKLKNQISHFLPSKCCCSMQQRRVGALPPRSGENFADFSWLGIKSAICSLPELSRQVRNQGVQSQRINFSLPSHRIDR